MMRTVIFTILTALAAAGPSAAQDPATEAARARAAEARKAARAAERAQRAERREDQRAEQTETVTRTAKLGPQGEIDLENMSGAITVTRGSGNDATITAVKRARAATEEEAREMLGLVTIDVAERAGRVEVRTRYPHFEFPRPPRPEPRRSSEPRSIPEPPPVPRMRAGGRNTNVSVVYNITAPAGTRMRVKTMSGDLTVTDITGDLSLEAMSGDIRIERGASVMMAKTMSGNVALTAVKGDGVIDTASMSGDVTLKQIKARRVNAAVVSGTISLADVNCERLDAQTFSGDVVFDSQLAKGARYRFQSHGGDVKLALAGDTGFELDANSWGGSVRSDLALKVHDEPGGGFRRAGGERNRTLRGTFGDGSAVVDVTTFSGAIIVTKRVAEKR